MEQLLYYVWKRRLFNTDNLTTDSGKPVKIIDVGIQNRDEGPDFFNAKIIIGKTLWAGNVEIHIYSSDWYKHQHQKNPLYNTVILHVVKYIDTKIYRKDKSEIPQVQLSYPDALNINYEYLIHQDSFTPCSLQLKEIPDIHLICWLNRLQVERLEYKTEKIDQLLNQYKNNWEEILYIMLARYFGNGINNEVFERLARSVPLIILLKHTDSLFSMEALLFGQAGFLGESYEANDYYIQLKKEYLFLKRKYNLKPLEKIGWKFHRLRPSNFPELRIAQFAAIYKATPGFFSSILNFSRLEDVFELFKKAPSPYWAVHYNFKQSSPFRNKILGKETIKSLVINVLVPVLFTYGKCKNNENIKEFAVNLLENMEPEWNSITREWEKYGIIAKNAADTQSLIHLKRFYCEQKKCLYCHIGQRLIYKKV